MPDTILLSNAVTHNPGEGMSLVAKKRTKQIRVDDDVAQMADRLASLQDPPISTPEFLTQFLRPLLRKELAKALDRAKKQLSEEES